MYMQQARQPQTLFLCGNNSLRKRGKPEQKTEGLKSLFPSSFSLFAFVDKMEGTIKNE
jgi:hypothetical protein